MPLAVGVDVGGTRLRVVGQDDGGRRTAVREVPVPRTAEALVDAVAALVREVGDGRPSAATAVGLPGWTGAEVPGWVPQLPFLDGFPLAGAVADRLGGSCVLLNDAQATLVAEVREGVVAGRSSAVLVAVGTGIGGAVLINRRLVRGVRGCAGSFGWLPMNGALPDRDHGGWEQVASGLALEQMGQPWGGAAGLLEAVRGGDGAARTITDRYATLLGRGTAALASVLDPEVVVVAGGISAAMDVLAAPLARAHRAAASPAGREVPVLAAACGPHAGVVGALHVALAPEVLL
ncbi:ROK family protein [Georgenia sp. AZ-5]|uniref:ROK family protein n=1 Tax=Georgenia sp. AZ-5 TaxID=3367526 RepID=UPI00375511CB